MMRAYSSQWLLVTTITWIILMTTLVHPVHGFFLFRSDWFFGIEVCQGQACADVNIRRSLMGNDGSSNNSTGYLQRHQDDEVARQFQEVRHICDPIPYELELVMTRETGHFMIFAKPSPNETQVDDDCFPFVAHVTTLYDIYDDDNDNHDGSDETEEHEEDDSSTMAADTDRTTTSSTTTTSSSENTWQEEDVVVKKIHFHDNTHFIGRQPSIQEFQQHMEAYNVFRKNVVSYNLAATRTFGDIMNAIEAIDIDDPNHKSYQSSSLPANCGTFLMEFAKQLDIPITEELISFVITNLAETAYSIELSTNSQYKVLQGTSPESMIAGLVQLMLYEHYHQ